MTEADDTLTCLICFDSVPHAASLVLCSAQHAFCAECCWRCCESALADGLVPAVFSPRGNLRSSIVLSSH